MHAGVMREGIAAYLGLAHEYLKTQRGNGASHMILTFKLTGPAEASSRRKPHSLLNKLLIYSPMEYKCSGWFKFAYDFNELVDTKKCWSLHHSPYCTTLGRAADLIGGGPARKQWC